MRGVVSCFAAVLLCACSSQPPAKQCVPGKSEACTGPGGCPGFQICNDEGSGFLACDCGGGAGGGAGGGTGGGAGGGVGGGSGGGGGGGDDGGIDAGTDGGTDAGTDAGTPCDPLAVAGLQGCAAGQKCTWIAVEDTPERVGKLGCVADGTVAFGDPCTNGPVGETTGYDDCVAGNICVSGKCGDICGFLGQAGAACATGSLCTRYSGLFSNGTDDPPYGACVEQCNPVTQQRSDGGTCGTNKGCYLLTSQTDTIAVCAGAGTVAHNVDIVGGAFANTCVPGAQPRRKDSVTMTQQCGGLCQMVDVTSTTNQSSEGGVSPNDCQTKWGASPPGDGTAGESCRYWWAREPFTPASYFGNNVGWCFKHAIFQYDSDGNTTLDSPFPRCTALTTGDVVAPIGNPPHNDAEYFWCVAAPTSFLAPLMPKDQQLEEPRLDILRGWRD